MQNPLIYPMAAHVVLTALLYALLTIARAPSVWGIGRRADGSNPWASAERRVSANLSNQFEWPVFFYAVCLLLVQDQAIPAAQGALAWVFVLGRVVHSLVQVFTTNVRLRGIIFMINFLSVLGMWLLLLVSQSGVAQ